MRNISLSLLFLTSLGFSSVYAETEIPNTFSRGTAAVASEVNENFTALATAIDDVITRIDTIEGEGLTLGDLASRLDILEEGALATSTLGTRIDTLEENMLTIDGLATRIDNLEGEVLEVDALATRIDNIEGEVLAVDALATRIDNLEGEVLTGDGLATRVDKLEGVGLTMANVAGNYTWTGLQVGLLKSDDNVASITETTAFNGIINFSSGGTFTARISQKSSGLAVNNVVEVGPEGGFIDITALGSDTGSDAFSGTWTLLGTTLTLKYNERVEVIDEDGNSSTSTVAVTVTLRGVSGNSLLIGLTTNFTSINSAYDKHLILLTKED